MKQIISLLSFLLFTAFIASCSLFETAEPTPERLAQHSISTSTGITQGQSYSGDSVVSWSDIPYAQPPVGELRWKAPRQLQAPQQLIAERDNTSCVQKASRYAGVSGEGMVGSEDCLYLDIKAPVDFASRNYPVMLWIHGAAGFTPGRGVVSQGDLPVWLYPGSLSSRCLQQKWRQPIDCPGQLANHQPAGRQAPG